MKLALAVMLLLLFAPGLVAQKHKEKITPGLSYENYQRIQVGDKYSYIVKLLGSDGKEDSSIGTTEKTYRWAAGRAHITVVFQDGRVTGKSQHGVVRPQPERKHIVG
jgi:hypothetical protein